MSVVPGSIRRLLLTKLVVQSGAILFEEGQPVTGAFLLEEGCLKLESSTFSVPRILWPGDFFQDRVPVTATHFSTARAVESCTLSTMSAAAFLEAAQQEPEFGDWLLRQRDRQILELERRIQWILTERADARVIDTLVNLAKRASRGRPDAIIPLTQSDLAKLAGNSRETTSAVLGSLRRQGLIEYRQRRVWVPSIDRLRAQSASAGAQREDHGWPEWNRAEQQT